VSIVSLRDIFHFGRDCENFADDFSFHLAPFWENAEWRSYTLEKGKDGEVQLVEETESLQRRGLPN
jgi:hypothetical protein